MFFLPLDNIFTPVTYVYIQIQLKQFFSSTCSKSLLFNVGKARNNDARADHPQRKKEGKTDYKPDCRSNPCFLW